MAFSRARRWGACWLLAGLLALAAGSVRSQAVRAGEVSFARGAAVAQSPGQAPRVMGRGLALREGDRLDVAEGGLAIVQMDDGTRMTLRPGTQLLVQRWRWQPESPGNSGLLALLRGGLRMIAGGVARQGPDALSIHTAVATIGIRGTDFEARLCERDCATPADGRQAPVRPATLRASARLVQAQGALTATDAQGRSRRLIEGSSLYPGELLESGRDGLAVLAFRDQSRLSIGASSRLRLDDFVFDPAHASEGRFFLSLLRGTLRAVTGLIAQANPQQVGFATAVATVGVRGTGLDLACFGPCAGEDAGPEGDRFQVCAWRGAVEVADAGHHALERLEPAQCAQVVGGQLQRSPIVLDLPLPRPDTVPVAERVFGQSPLPQAAAGLFVAVREGHVSLDGALDLGRGEVGYVGDEGRLRLADTPALLQQRTPLPLSPVPGASLDLGGIGLPVEGMCR